MKTLYRVREKNNEYFFSKEKDTRTWFEEAAKNGLKWGDDFNKPYKSNVSTTPFHQEYGKSYRYIDPLTGVEETIKFSKIVIV